MIFWQSYDAFGVTLGIIAALAYLTALAYPFARAISAGRLAFRLGRAKAWRTAHIWAGVAFIVFAMLHARFSIPDDAMTFTLISVAAASTLTGALTWVAQKIIPKKISAATTTEILFSRLAPVHAVQMQKVQNIISSAGASVVQFYNDHLRRPMAAIYFDAGHFTGTAGRVSDTMFVHASRLLELQDKNSLELLRQLYHAKIELDIHFTMQTTLRAVVWLHAFLTLALLILIVMHVFSVLAY